MKASHISHHKNFKLFLFVPRFNVNAKGYDSNTALIYNLQNDHYYIVKFFL